ncbi:MAG: hypothetical protein RL410_667 [Actinomycetota bacterium]|jgi:hypothetical protein
MSELPAAGWYQDPANPDNVRFWDGKQWTEQVAPRSNDSGKVAIVVPQRSSREMFGSIAFGIGFVAIALVSFISLLTA